MSDAQALKNLNVMTTEGVAEASGLTIGTIRVMVVRSRKRRGEGISLPTDLPEPDLMVFRSPLWRKSTITQWVKKRDSVRQDEGTLTPPRRRRVTRKSVARAAEAAKAAKKSAKKAASQKPEAVKLVAKKVAVKKAAPKKAAAQKVVDPKPVVKKVVKKTVTKRPVAQKAVAKKGRATSPA